MKSRSIVKFFSLVLAGITLVGTAVIPVFADNESAAILPDSTQAAPYLPTTINPQVQIETEHSVTGIRVFFSVYSKLFSKLKLELRAISEKTFISEIKCLYCACGVH